LITNLSIHSDIQLTVWQLTKYSFINVLTNLTYIISFAKIEGTFKYPNRLKALSCCSESVIRRGEILIIRLIIAAGHHKVNHAKKQNQHMGWFCFLAGASL